MTILLHIDIFPSILKKLPIRDLIIHRRVCHLWKEWIDDYLQRQTTLLLEKEDCTCSKSLTHGALTMDINYSKVLLNKLEISSASLNRNSSITIADSLRRMFPNLEELYIFLFWEENFDYKSLLGIWKDTLKILIIPGLYQDGIPEIVEWVNQYDKLETFGVMAGQQDCDDSLSFIENEHFLTRLTSVWVPSIQWVRHHDSLPNIQRIVSLRHNEVTSEQFPNVQRILLEFYLFPGGLMDDICVKLRELAHLGHQNLCCLEMYFSLFENGYCEEDPHAEYAKWVDEMFDETNYPPFWAEINLFPGVKTLKLEFSQSVFMEYVLRNCPNFNHIETLIINYKIDMEYDKIHLPTNFLELLPKSVKRIQNIEFHFEQENREEFKNTDFLKFPYKVKIFNDL